MITVSCIRCSNCGDILYSRTVHDFHYCYCGRIAIDGGFDYVKICGDIKHFLDIFQLEIDATKTDLYYDWNSRKNKYGRIERVKQLEIEKFPKINMIKRSPIQKIFKKYNVKCS